MWLPVLDKKRLINLQHVREIHAEPFGQTSNLTVTYSDGKTTIIHEFKAVGDAESVLKQIKDALASEILTGPSFDH